MLSFSAFAVTLSHEKVLAAVCYEDRVTWDQAEERCKNKSAELYYIPEQKYIDLRFPSCMDQNDNTGYWIGLRRKSITRETVKQEDGKGKNVYFLVKIDFFTKFAYLAQNMISEDLSKKVHNYWPETHSVL